MFAAILKTSMLGSMLGRKILDVRLAVEPRSCMPLLLELASKKLKASSTSEGCIEEPVVVANSDIAWLDF
jgi:hypothetical protein